MCRQDRQPGRGPARTRAGSRFAFVDLFDDEGFYAGRDRALEVIANAGGEIGSAQRLSEIFTFRFPLNLAKVLEYAVIVTGTKSPTA